MITKTKNMLARGQQEREDAVDKLKSICPDFTEYLNHLVDFHESRNELTSYEREIAIISSLITLGSTKDQIKIHFHKALDLGITVTQLSEIIMHISMYAGMPAAVNAFTTLKSAINSRDAANIDDHNDS